MVVFVQINKCNVYKIIIKYYDLNLKKRVQAVLVKGTERNAWHSGSDEGMKTENALSCCKCGAPWEICYRIQHF